MALIAHVAPPNLLPSSGVLRAIVELAAAEVELGHDVQIWSLWGRDDTAWPVLETATARGVALRATVVPRHSFGVGHPAVRMAAVDRPALLNLHWGFVPANAQAVAGTGGEVPYTLSPHGGYARRLLDTASMTKRLYGRLVERRLLENAAVVFALTSFEAKEVQRFASRAEIRIVPNGVRLTAPTTARMSRSSGASRVAVFVGDGTDPAKRLPQIVDGFEGAVGWRLVIVGPTPARMPVPNGVELLGPVDHPRALAELGRADVVVLLSESEGDPLVLLEAASVGTPAVVSPEVERRCGVSAAGAGWVTTPADLAAQLGAIADLDDRTWRRAGAAAAGRTSGRSWAEIAAKRLAAAGIGTAP